MPNPSDLKATFKSRPVCEADRPAFPEEEIHGSLPRRFEKVVDLFPRRPAVAYEGREVAYEDLNRAANQVARAIGPRLGAKPALVAVIMDLGQDQITAMLGVLKAGAVHVVLDPSFPQAKTAEIIEVYGPDFLIADQANADLARAVFPHPDRLVIFEAIPAHLADHNLDLDPGPDEYAAIFYTADSAGRPRGVLYDHRGLLHAFWDVATVAGNTSTDRIAQWQSMAFFGAVVTCFETLLCGACLCLYNMKQGGLPGLIPWITQQQVTSVAFMPSAFRRLFSEGVRPEAVKAVRVLRLRGEAVEQCDLDLYRKIFPDQCVLGLSLGMTETCRVAYSNLTKDSRITEKVLPMACLARDKEISLRDESGLEVPWGEPGEIVVRSPYIFKGYWPLGLWGESAESGTRGPRVCHTGDWGRFLPDGSLQHVGRKDDLVKIRGNRIQLGEIEAALAAIQQVKEAAVVGRDDVDGIKYLHAYFVPREAGSVFVETLKAQLKTRLPAYCIPSQFTMMAALPRNALGRIDRDKLPESGARRPELQTGYVPPKTELEVRLVKLWQDILKVEPIGLNDNFFDLGGDSLNAVELALEIEGLAGGSISVADFLVLPTIAQLAGLLGQSGSELIRSCILPVKPMGSRPPFFAVSPGVDNALIYRFLGSYLDPDQPLYAIRRNRQADQGRLPGTIAQMVENDLNELLVQQPSGPYYLGGYSLGAYLAYELAQELIKRGHQVGLLAFFDCPAHPGWWQVLTTLKERAAYVSFVLKNGEGKLHQRFYNNFRTWLRNRLLNARAALKVAPSTKTGEARERLNRSRRPLVAGKRAMRKYRLLPYPGTIAFFQTEIFKYVPEKQWRRVAPDIRVHQVQGNHHTLLHEPHVAGLAELFNQELERAQAKAEK